MLTVGMLTVANKAINSHGFVDPLVSSRDVFRDFGVQILDARENDRDIEGSDILIVDSKYYKEYWKDNEELAYDSISQLRTKTNQLYWFDSGDSTGMIQTQVFPFVDSYLKAQVLKDKSLYRKSFYGGRIYTDYFFHEKNIQDSTPEGSRQVKSEDQEKIKPAWNYGLATGYGNPGHIIGRLRSRLNKTQYHPTGNYYVDAQGGERNGLFVRMNVTYDRETVAYQRKHMMSLVRSLTSNRGTVSKRRYLKEMRSSQLVLSPFGWGEINIRDFECFTFGALLIKPDMSHIATFPDYYVEWETYVPVNWDLEDLVQCIDNLLLNYTDHVQMAIQGQKRFRDFADGPRCKEEFVKYVMNLFSEIY